MVFPAVRGPGSCVNPRLLPMGIRVLSKLPAISRPRAVVYADICRQSDGQALIEVAVTLPVLMLLVTGIFSFGIYINNNMQLANAVATGARTLSISRGVSTDPCSTASSAVISAAPTLNSSSMTFAYSINGVAYSGASCTSATANMVQGQPASVTVTYPCTLAIYGHNYAPVCSLTAKTTELIQ
jgi:Flp pilus assembly protein TadG